MSGSRRPKMDHKPSIKYGFSPPDKGTVDFADFDLKGSENHKSKIPNPRNAEILGTRELISAISCIYDQSVRPLSTLLPKSRRRFNEDSYQDCNFLCHLPEEKTWISFATAENQNLSFNLTRSSHPHPPTSPKLKKLSVRDKILLIKPSGGTESLLRTLLNNSLKIPLKSHSTEGLSSVALASLVKFRKLYTSDTTLDDSKNHVSCIVKDKHERDDSAPVIFHVPLHEATSIDDRIPGNPNSYQADNHHIVPSLREHESLSVTTSEPKHVALSNVEVSATQIPNSKPITDSLSNVTSSARDNLEESELSVIVDHNSKSETCLPESSKPHYLLAKQEHAYAGAMAGICVSLCLHPIDTIKTVVQSCRANQTSLYNVSRSIISERGAMGLYRGISTNIASSAPISAVYTFTYESVKGTLLSVFPKVKSRSINLWPTV